jgi:hypothetical protein
MNAMQKAVLAMTIGIAATAQAQQVIEIEGQRHEVDPSAMIGEDSGSFYLSRKSETWASRSTTSPAARRTDMSMALIGEDSGSAYFASLPMGPGVDRQIVVAALDEARASGELAAMVSEDSGSAWLSRRPVTTVTASIDAGFDIAGEPARSLASAKPDSHAR